MAEHGYSPAELAELDQRHAIIRNTVDELAMILKYHNNKCQTPMCDMVYTVRQLLQATTQTGNIMPVCEIAAFLLCERAKAAPKT